MIAMFSFMWEIGAWLCLGGFLYSVAMAVILFAISIIDIELSPKRGDLLEKVSLWVVPTGVTFAILFALFNLAWRYQ